MMRLLPKFLFLIIISGLMAGIGITQTAEGEPGVLRNPLNPYGGADPWIQYYDGYYYLATTTWRSELMMSKSPTLAGLKTAIPTQIYAETDPSRCCNMWAPEFYLLEGEDGELHWYFYYSAGTSGTLDNQRTHVLESEGTDPMGPYTYKARIFDPVNDVWAIDGSILQIEDDLYFLFSSWQGPNQNMFIAPMSNPWTLSGSRVLIATPQYDWERVSLNVNEGPVALYHDDDIFLIYSASHCATPDYKLGLILYNGGDPLDPASWEKQPEPVFQRSDENSVFGPAHNGFFKSPDGTEDWIVYHANDSTAGACDDGRTTRVQRITWSDDGLPEFGEPVSTEEVIAAPSGDNGIDPVPEFEELIISRIRSMSYDESYLRHSDVFARVDVSVSPHRKMVSFFILPGLADPDAISIRSINLPSHFLVHQDNVVQFAPFDGSDDFAERATWILQPGPANPDWNALEAYSRPGYIIGQQFGVMALVENSDSMSDRMKEDSTFLLEITGE